MARIQAASRGSEPGPDSRRAARDRSRPRRSDASRTPYIGLHIGLRVSGRPARWPMRPVPGPRCWRAACWQTGPVTQQKIIAVRHLRAGGRLIPVHFSRNAGGSVAGRAVLGAQDTPILDGPDPEAVLAVLRDVIDGLLLARRPALASRG